MGKGWKVEEVGKSGRSLLAMIAGVESYISPTCFIKLYPLGYFLCCSQYLRACASLEISLFSFVLNYN